MHFDIQEALRTLRTLHGLEAELHAAADSIAETFEGGNKLLTCGNGGSASCASHLAAEFMGRLRSDRRPYPAFSLGSDESVVSAIANDYGFDSVFSRQIEAAGADGDTLVVFSTSGDSPNVVRALEAAAAHGIGTIAFLGEGGAARALAGTTLCVDSDSTARVQEAHTLLLHILASRVEHLLGHG